MRIAGVLAGIGLAAAVAGGIPAPLDSPARSAAPMTPQVFPPLRGWFSSQQGAFIGPRSYSVAAVTATSPERVAPLSYAAFAGMRRGQVVIWVSTRWELPIQAIAAATTPVFSLRRAQVVHHPCLSIGRPCLPGVRYTWTPFPRLTAAHPFVSVDAYVRNGRPGMRLRRVIQARIHELLVVNLR